MGAILEPLSYAAMYVGKGGISGIPLQFYPVHPLRTGSLRDTRIPGHGQKKIVRVLLQDMCGKGMPFSVRCLVARKCLNCPRHDGQWPMHPI